MLPWTSKILNKNGGQSNGKAMAKDATWRWFRIIFCNESDFLTCPTSFRVDMIMKIVIPRTSNIPNNMNPMICAIIGHDSHSATLGSEKKSERRMIRIRKHETEECEVKKKGIKSNQKVKV